MNPLPPLSEEERARLRASIMQDGVIIPVLHDARGNVIDGHHRIELATELGVDYPTQTLDVDEETADRLRIALNWARRQLDTLTGYELIAELARRHEAIAKAEATDRMAKGGMGGLDKGVSGASTPSVKAKSREVIAARINEDLATLGVEKKVSPSTVYTATAAAALPEATKERIRKGDVSVAQILKQEGHGGRKASQRRAPSPVKTMKPRRVNGEDLGRAARIRATNAELQYQSMLNAPASKLNLPLLRRAEKVMECLTELIAVDPDKAASQLPIERCREFTIAHAEWWARFAAACEERRQQETPDLAPRPFRPLNSVLNPVVLGTKQLPAEERHLPPGERAVLDWLRARIEPATVVEIVVALRNRSKESVALRIRKLCASGLVEVAGKVGKESAYRAVADRADRPRP